MNKRGKVCSKKKMNKEPTEWQKSVTKARTELGLPNHVWPNNKVNASKDGKALYMAAKAKLTGRGGGA